MLKDKLYISASITPKSLIIGYAMYKQQQVFLGKEFNSKTIEDHF